MKIVRFVDGEGRARFGRLDARGRVVPLRGDFANELEFSAAATTGEPAAVARVLAPVEPPNVFAIGLNYRKHAEEGGARSLPVEPLVFLKATSSVIGDGEAIVLPRSAPGEVDYEAELAVVIGRTARRVSEERALDYVAGFTCANDVSARDCQRVRDKQWARAKSFDTFCPLGPCLVTPDEFDAGDAAIRSTLNGRVMQDSNISDMIFPVPALVGFLSHQFTLRPGTVILTGTPHGVGFARTPPVFLRAGDRIEIEIEGIGRLSNPVVADPAA